MEPQILTAASICLPFPPSSATIARGGSLSRFPVILMRMQVKYQLICSQPSTASSAVSGGQEGFYLHCNLAFHKGPSLYLGLFSPGFIPSPRTRTIWDSSSRSIVPSLIYLFPSLCLRDVWTRAETKNSGLISSSHPCFPSSSLVFQASFVRVLWLLQTATCCQMKTAVPASDSIASIFSLASLRRTFGFGPSETSSSHPLTNSR